MRIKIYQINTNRDSHRIKHFQDPENIDPSIYDEVFNAEIDDNNLEDVYRRFNTEGHPLHRGHSLSVSDIVVVEGNVPNLVGRIRFYNSSSAFEECNYTDEAKFRKDIHDAYEVGRTIEVDELSDENMPSVECGAYYCDSAGFQKIDFDESQAHKPDNLMRIVYVGPHKAPYAAEIENSLAAEQKAVGGLIELVYNEDDTLIICNDEGKLIGMDGNRCIGDGSSIIAGPFFVVGDDGENFRSLTESEVKKYMDVFAEIEDISQDEMESDMGFTFYAW